MPPAVVAAGIGAAGAIGGAVLGSSAQKKAADKAADHQQAATEAQLQLGRESLALQEKMFNQGLGFNALQAGTSYDALSPFVGNGLAASNAMTALLGLSPAAMPANPYSALALRPGQAPTTGGGTTTPPATGGGNGNWGGPGGATPGPNPNVSGPFGDPLLNNLLR